MGSLGRLSQSLEQAKIEGENLIVVLEYLLRFSQQNVLLVGQTNIVISYHRRLSALDGVMNNLSQARSMLKTKYELLQEEDKDPSWQEFREQIFKIVKSHKHSKESLASTVFKDPPSLNQPFWKGPPQNQNKLRGSKIPRTSEQIIFNRNATATTTTGKEIIRTKVNVTQKK